MAGSNEAAILRLEPKGTRMTDTKIPAHPDDLTPAWLSEVLDAPVASVELLDHAFSTNQRVACSATPASDRDRNTSPSSVTYS